MKEKVIFIFSLFFLFTACDRVADPIDLNKNEILLTYKFMHGWTGKISSMKIFENKESIKYINEEEVEFEFTETEKKELDSLLIHFSEFQNEYKPHNGAWVDISYHWLVHYPESKADSVSIYEPLNSEQIPAELRELIELLLSKF
ncbi:MAG: hypothetical protein ABIJ40_00040 [Bacteroidota bacterium]